MKKIKISDKLILEGSKPFVVAEAGVNYYDIAKKLDIGDIEAAKLMIKEAANAGADAIKFQTYKADKLAVSDSPAYWAVDKERSKSQYELFAKYDKFDIREYAELADYCKKSEIIFMSTPFDDEAVDFLDELVPAFKIASADITNIPFIRHIASKGKPIFLSTGAATFEEISEAVSAIESEGNNAIVIMHCILKYPTPYEETNLLVIQRLHDMFPEYVIGYSDHTLPDAQMLILVTAYLLGARVLEKHFTLDKSLTGNDHYHAMDSQDLKMLRNNLQLVRAILGSGEKDIQKELAARTYARRSVVARVEIPEGTKITRDMLICKRPGTGISPKLLNSIIGMTTKKNIQADEILHWDALA
jgi:sialic acid synthase SpsE